MVQSAPKLVGIVDAVVLPGVQIAAGGEAEVTVVLEVVAKPAGRDQPRSNGPVRTKVGGDIRSGVAQAMGVGRLWNSRTSARVGSGGSRAKTPSAGVEEAAHHIGGGQVFASLALVLIEPGTKHANLPGHRVIDTSGGVVGLRILAKRGVATIGGTVVDGALSVVPLRVETQEEENLILENRAAEGETREKIAGVGLNRLSLLILSIYESTDTAQRVIALIDGRGTIQRLVLELSKNRAMVVVLAFPHDHIDHAAQRATVLGFNAFTLH